ncbi:MAG: hypothetical protein JSS82_15740 [Bacteroidetes bacterium]|nr:hypothetical protein [Bacteroidota bacterium]
MASLSEDYEMHVTSKFGRVFTQDTRTEEQKLADEYKKNRVLEILRRKVGRRTGTNERFLMNIAGSGSIKPHMKYGKQPGMPCMHSSKELALLASRIYTDNLSVVPSDMWPRIINCCCKFNTGLTNIQCRPQAMLVSGYPGYQNETNFSAIRVTRCVRFPMNGTMVFRLFLCSGKVTCTGGKSTESTRRSAFEFVAYMSNFGLLHANVYDFSITNIISSVQTPFWISVVGMVSALGDKVAYKPKKFPAAFYVDAEENGKAISVFFPCGQVLVAGVSDQAQLPNLIEKAVRMAERYKTTQKIAEAEIMQYKERNDCPESADFAQRTDNVVSVYNEQAIQSIVNQSAAMSEKTMEQIMFSATQFRVGMGVPIGEGNDEEDDEAPGQLCDGFSAPIVEFDSSDEDDSDQTSESSDVESDDENIQTCPPGSGDSYSEAIVEFDSD